MRATEALDAHREVTECQIFSKVLDAFPSRRLYEEEGCSIIGDTTVWRLSLYSPLAALHEAFV